MQLRRQFLQTGGSIVACMLCRSLDANVPASSRYQSTAVYAGKAFGTQWQLSLAESQDAVPAIAEIEKQVRYIDALMSPYRADSELTRFNYCPNGTSMLVSEPTATVVSASLGLARDSGGAFDPTVGPRVNRFGFSPITGSVTSTHTDLRLQQNALSKLKQGTTLDLCGIAKGYALDLAMQAVEAAGYTDFLLEMGGELKSRGLHPSGRLWRIAMEPFTGGTTMPARILELNNTAIATSGIAKNSFIWKKQRYSHLVSARDQSNNEPALYSVSVLHNSAMLADAWSTALYVKGFKQGIQLARERSLDAFFVLDQQHHYHTESTGQFNKLTNYRLPASRRR